MLKGKTKVYKLILISIILLISSTRNAPTQAQGQSSEDFSKLDPHTRISSTGKLLPPSRSIPSDVMARPNTNRPDDKYNPVILSSRAFTGSAFEQHPVPSEDHVSPNYIVGPDNRTQSNTNNYPDRAVVHITGDQIGHCTGWLYDDDTVATAAHCIHTGGQWVTGITVIPGRNGSQSAPYGTCRARSSHTVVGWITTGFPEYDYGAIKLDCRVGNTVGWFGITNQQTGNIPATTNSYLKGYPGDKPWGTQWGDQATSTRWVAGPLRSHTHDMIGGTSGAALYYNFSGCSPCTFAINKGEHPATGSNIALGLYTDAINNLLSWR